MAFGNCEHAVSFSLDIMWSSCLEKENRNAEASFVRMNGHKSHSKTLVVKDSGVAPGNAMRKRGAGHKDFLVENLRPFRFSS